MELLLLTVSLASACASELGGSTSFTESRQLYNGPPHAYSYVDEDHNLLDELETPNSASKDQQMVDERLDVADKSNNHAYPEVDDTAMILGRSRWCRSKDGKCRSDKFRCPHKYQESPYGRPYCTSRKRRCCYTGLPAPTTPTIVTTTKYTTHLATKKPVIKTTTLTTAIPTTTTTTTTTPTTTTVNAICPYGFELLDQQCIKISESKATWRKAKDNCADIKHNSWKFQLIVVKDPQGLKEKITNLKKITDNFWVGASSLDNDFFSWVSGKKVNSSFPWGKDDNGVQQPKGKEEDCMILRYFQKQKLYHYVDNRCGKIQRYVCEAIKG